MGLSPLAGWFLQWLCLESSLLPGWPQDVRVLWTSVWVVSPLCHPCRSCSVPGWAVGAAGVALGPQVVLLCPERCQRAAPRPCCAGTQAPACPAAALRPRGPPSSAGAAGGLEQSGGLEAPQAELQPLACPVRRGSKPGSAAGHPAGSDSASVGLEPAPPQPSPFLRGASLRPGNSTSSEQD